MADQKALAKLKELYDSGTMTPDQKASVEALSRKGVLDLGVGQTFKESRSAALREKMAGQREEVFSELAQEVGPIQATLIGAGKGFVNVGRSVGLIDPADPTEYEGIAALKRERPITTGAGETLGEAAPFAPLGLVAAEGAGAAASRAGLGPKAVRLVSAGGAGTAGGLEGALLSEDQTKGAFSGAALATGAELFLPVLGTMLGKFFRKIMGKAPKGSLLDNLGTPTAELKEALDMSGRTFEDLTEEAQAFIKSQPAGADPKQVARAALFAEEGVPISKGELTKDFKQLSKEESLLGSAEDIAAEPFRTFKLKQSERIKNRLTDLFPSEFTKTETGQLIKEALEGRYNQMSTATRELYDAAVQNVKDVGSVPIFTKRIEGALPGIDELDDLAITAGASVSDLQTLLAKYGVIEPTEEISGRIKKYTPLDTTNFERFRKSLNNISSADTTGAIRGIVHDLKSSLDTELDTVGRALEDAGVADDIVDPFKKARAAHAKKKGEYSDKALAKQLIATGRDGVDQMIESSKVYSDKIASKAIPAERVGKLMETLKEAGEEGALSLEALKTTTIFDLVNAGFSTPSRQIDGIPVFNHTAFNKRLETLGKDKLKEIFKDNLPVLNRLNNIERIATELTPPDKTTPKGSANVILDLFNRMGISAISAKPGFNLAFGAIKAVTDPIKKASFVKGSLSPVPEVLPKSTPFRAQTLGEQLQDPEAYLEGLKTVIPNNYPGILAALGIAQQSENENQ